MPKEYIVETEYEHGVGSINFFKVENFDALLIEMCKEPWPNVQKMVIELAEETPDAHT